MTESAPLALRCRNTLGEKLAVSRQRGRQADDHLQLSRLLHEAVDAAEIKKALTLHALCHSFANHLRERSPWMLFNVGMQDTRVQRWLRRQAANKA